MIAALLASPNLSDEALAAWPVLRLAKVAALAVSRQNANAMALLQGVDFDELPVVISELPLPASQLPVFKISAAKPASTSTPHRSGSGSRNRRRTWQRPGREALVAEVQAAGYTFSP